MSFAAVVTAAADYTTAALPVVPVPMWVLVTGALGGTLLIAALVHSMLPKAPWEGSQTVAATVTAVFGALCVLAALFGDAAHNDRERELAYGTVIDLVHQDHNVDITVDDARALLKDGDTITVEQDGQLTDLNLKTLTGGRIAVTATPVN